MREEGVLVSSPLPADEPFEASLRPQSLGEFVGQEALKERLRISIEACRLLERPLDHMLLSGPPGLGKTTLAQIIAVEMGTELRQTSGPAVERPGDLAAMLSNLDNGDVFFIDEIHRLPRAVEEVLYSAMEDFQLDIVLGKGPSAQSIRLDLARFTLVGATTRMGMVAAPLRDRFGAVDRLDYYEDGELREVIIRAAGILGIDVTGDGAALVAGRSRGTPRIANRLLARVREYAVARANGVVDAETAVAALTIWEVDDAGLDKVDRAILDATINKFGGGPVGLSTLAIAVGEEPETVEGAYEPFLLQRGLLKRTPRGRVATAAAYRHLGLEPPSESQGTLL
ncbi:MAG TPA: Holliday junction branch migration DNA helicase RuvB [Actinobacteria bacterium]|nr:Holliday junction branch migration DNA helicase RuvB [Actinomycetota bacterium]